MNPLKIVPLLACSMLLALCLAGCSYDDPEEIFKGTIDFISIENLSKDNKPVCFEGPNISTYYKKVDKNGKRKGKWSSEWPLDIRDKPQGGSGPLPYTLIFTNGKVYKAKDYRYNPDGNDKGAVESLWSCYCDKYGSYDTKLGYACRWDYQESSNKLYFDHLEFNVEKADLSGITISIESSQEYEKHFNVAYHDVYQLKRITLPDAQLSDIRLYDSRKELYLAMLQIMRADCGDIMEAYWPERYDLSIVEDNVRNDRYPYEGAYISSADKK